MTMLQNTMVASFMNETLCEITIYDPSIKWLQLKFFYLYLDMLVYNEE